MPLLAAAAAFGGNSPPRGGGTFTRGSLFGRGASLARNCPRRGRGLTFSFERSQDRLAPAAGNPPGAMLAMLRIRLCLEAGAG